MQFESKMKRSFWLNMALGLIPDIFIAFAIAIYFEVAMLGFISILVGLQILYTLLWVKDSVWSWIVFLLWGRRQLKMFLFDYLKESHYPEPDIYEGSVDDYFAEVANDATQPIELRLKAAKELGSFSAYFPSRGQIQTSMRISMAFEDALMEYKRIFPTKIS